MEINIEDYLDYVHHILYRYVGATRETKDYEDMFQAGCEGLIKAKKIFDPEKFPSFYPIAKAKILGHILDFIRKNISGMDFKTKGTAYKKYRGLVMSGASEEEILSTMGMDKKTLDILLSTCKPTVYLDAQASEDIDGEVYELIGDHRICVESEAIDNVTKFEILKKAKKLLTPKEYLLVEMILDGGLNGTDLSGKLGVSQSRVSQMMTNLRGKMSRVLRGY